MIGNLWIHPAVLLLFGALLIPFLPGRLRQAWLLFVPALAFARTATMPHGVFAATDVLGWWRR